MPGKKKIEDPISYLENFFSTDPNMINLFNALLHELAESLEQQGSAELTYGINMTIKSGMQEKEQQRLPSLENKEQDLLVEVLSDEKKISVIAEVPGVTKSEIRVDYTPQILSISTNNADQSKKYFRQVSLPEHFGSRRIDAKYTNGVLEVIMTKGKKINKKNDIKID